MRNNHLNPRTMASQYQSSPIPKLQLGNQESVHSLVDNELTMNSYLWPLAEWSLPARPFFFCRSTVQCHRKLILTDINYQRHLHKFTGNDKTDLLSPEHKGFSLKESEISRGLVSPARRALKKICTAEVEPRISQKKSPSGPCPNGQCIFHIENVLTLFSTPQCR